MATNRESRENQELSVNLTYREKNRELRTKREYLFEFKFLLPHESLTLASENLWKTTLGNRHGTLGNGTKQPLENHAGENSSRKTSLEFSDLVKP